MVGSLVAPRVFPQGCEQWALAPGLAGLDLAAIVLVAAQRRYRTVHDQLTACEVATIGGGRLIVVLVVAAEAFAIQGLAPPGHE